jgi:hypothetical protein
MRWEVAKAKDSGKGQTEILVLRGNEEIQTARERILKAGETVSARVLKVGEGVQRVIGMEKKRVKVAGRMAGTASEMVGAMRAWTQAA